MLKVPGGRPVVTELRATGSLLRNDSLLQVMSRLLHILGLAEIAPIVFIGTEGEDFFSSGGETQIRGDDRECAVFSHHRKKARRNEVDARKCQGLYLLRVSQ